jgi:hypothetical protein
MVRIPAGIGTKNDCAGEAQQQFTRPDPFGVSSKPLLGYKETNDDTLDK